MGSQRPAPGRQLLWQYGIAAAFLSTALLWVLLGSALGAMHLYLGWPDSDSLRFLMPAVLLVGLAPVIFVVVDYVAGQRGVIDIKGFKVDFSQAVAQYRSFEIPANIGSSGASLADSGGIAIRNELDSAIQNQIVRIDLEAGNAWWVSRLLVLCAGAVGVGSPGAIVFVGMKNRAPQTYLGWAEPQTLVTALRNASTWTDNREIYQPINLVNRKVEPKAPTTISYDELYEKAVIIARQLPALNYFITHLGALPTAGQITTEFDGVGRYVQDITYVSKPETAMAYILMDQIALLKLENAPDKLTLGRFEELFAHCICTDAIELQDPPETQIAKYANAKAAYVALTNNGTFEQLVEVASLGRIFIKQLIAPEAPSSRSTSR